MPVVSRTYLPLLASMSLTTVRQAVLMVTLSYRFSLKPVLDTGSKYRNTHGVNGVDGSTNI